LYSKCAKIKEWQNLRKANWLNYENNIENDLKFGKLYNWYAMIDERNISPIGWHVPSHKDWNELEDYLIDNEYYNIEDYDYCWHDSANEYRPDNIAISLAAKSEWKFFNTIGACGYDLSKNNSSGFNAKPNGNSLYGRFYDIGLAAYWWSNVKDSNTCGRTIGYGMNNLQYINYLVKESHYAIRCLKD